MIIAVVLVTFVLLAGVSIIRGAPYVPTHKSQIMLALKMLEKEKVRHIVDVGSGDGRMLIESAKRGIRSTGYEINPILYVVSKLRTRAYRDLITVRLADMWREKLPQDTDAVFVFTMGRYMPRLVKKIKKEGFSKMFLVSYAFELEDLEATKNEGAIFLYEIKNK